MQAEKIHKSRWQKICQYINNSVETWHRQTQTELENYPPARCVRVDQNSYILGYITISMVQVQRNYGLVPIVTGL